MLYFFKIILNKSAVVTIAPKTLVSSISMPHAYLYG